MAHLRTASVVRPGKAAPALAGDTSSLRAVAASTTRHGYPGDHAARCGERPSLLQPKLTISNPNDRYEQEADRVADQVLRMPDPAAPGPGTDPAPIRPLSIQRQRPACEPEELQRRPAGSPDAETGYNGLDAVSGALRRGGRPLDPDTRAFFEPRFGVDFGAVRIHTGREAAESAQAIRALAYTVGHNIVFNTSQYVPQTDAGRRLLAHELTHVVQQGQHADGLIQRQTFECGDLLANPSIVSLVAGSAVHAAIAADFAGRVAGATQVMIPGASAGPLRSAGICGDDTTSIAPQLIGGAAGAGFPDLARITAGRVLQVAEIKPAAVPCLIDGEEQMLRYLDQGNATDPAQVAWRAAQGVSVVMPMPTDAYQPPSLSLGIARVETAWCSPGLLAYTVRGPGVPVPVRVPADERSRERRNYRESAGDRIPVTVAVGAGAVATAVAGRALWRHFWRAVAERFALRAAVAAGLAAADGPLPFGEIIDIGIGVATAIEIFVVWDDLWREADRLAVAEAA